MIIEGGLSALTEYLDGLLAVGFPNTPADDFRPILGTALERTEYCFERVALPPYQKNGRARFDPLHMDQCAQLFYYLSNEAYRQLENSRLAAKFCQLNKMRNGILVMYDTELPRIMLLIHTVGTVLGKAQYADYFVAYQNVTVGTNRGKSPVFGERVILSCGSIVAGDCEVGTSVRVFPNASVWDQEIPPHCGVSGTSPNLAIRPYKTDLTAHYFTER